MLAATSGHVVEGALGYFINPIFTVLLGVIFLRERLRPAQWVALGISAVAIVIIAIGYGTFPWIALALTLSFGLYGFIKKRVGGQVDAISGLTIETAWLDAGGGRAADPGRRDLERIDADRRRTRPHRARRAGRASPPACRCCSSPRRPRACR